ncbi:clathrin coat assembly protein AP180, putative [Babesia microti strain RI]|uniref:Clathrin coat assembly protein AP180, putative n=1 Tax=Babesia microti (strain RI) TaxID=1133968 RepID=I7J844_BABMR|nr:clathrin coat assembly protein AP180, putative [Babesia microti strain RI]CCF72649.1 clathrin coat assembly protein AP180, putative [Babesia microti strain RI]|eukprot:XP_012647258.1 clathrin coat assembly protein AP180, putative [Babesia microti strain RI]
MRFKSNSQSVTLINRNQLDKLLKEALYDKSVGCIDSILNGIAQASHHMPFYEIISKRTWSAINSKPSKWLYIQKGLTLLEYLVLNGAEWCISDVLQHLEDINKVVKLNREYSAKTSFLTGKPLAPPHTAFVITEKCKNLINLVRMGDDLAKKREQVAKNKDRYIGVGQKNGILEISTLHKPIIAVDYSKSFFSRQKNSINLGMSDYEHAIASQPQFTLPYSTTQNNVATQPTIHAKEESPSVSNASDLSESYDSDDSSSSSLSSSSSSSLSSSSSSSSSDKNYNLKHNTRHYDANFNSDYNNTTRTPTSYTTPTSYMLSDNSTFFSQPTASYVPYVDIYKLSDHGTNVKTPKEHQEMYNSKVNSHYTPRSQSSRNHQSTYDQTHSTVNLGDKPYKLSNPFAY